MNIIIPERTHEIRVINIKTKQTKTLSISATSTEDELIELIKQIFVPELDMVKEINKLRERRNKKEKKIISSELTLEKMKNE